MSHNLRRLLLAATGASALVAYGAAQESSPVRFGGGDTPGQSAPFNRYDSPDFETLKRQAAAAAAPTAQLGGNIETATPGPSGNTAANGGFRSSTGPWTRTTPRAYDPKNNVAQVPGGNVAPVPTAGVPAGATSSGVFSGAVRDGSQELDLGPPPAMAPPSLTAPSLTAPSLTAPVLTAPTSESPFATKGTSFMKDPPVRSGATGVSAPTSGGAPAGKPTPNASGSSDGTKAEGMASAPGESPKRSNWPIVLLFASVAANVFFCYIAWDAHSKYRDLIADMSESDSRLGREQRRLRREAPGTGRSEPEEVEYLGVAEAS